MPFQSEKQRRYLWANEPKIARDWADTYGSRIEKNDGGISQLVKSGPGRPGYGGPHETYDTGKSYEAAKADPRPGGGADNWQKQALQQHKQQQQTKSELKDLALKAAEDKKEEKVEKFRNQQGFFKNQKTRNFFLDKNLQQKQFMKNLLKGRDFYDLDPSEQEDIYGQYMKARGAGTIDAYADILGGGGGGGSYYPRDMHPGTGTEQITTEVVKEPMSAFQKSLTGNVETPDYYVGSDPTASNLAWGQAYGVDPRTMGQTSWAANGGRIPAAFGGIMDSSTGRRAYGFGSIFKKIGRAAKKVLKSPIAKGALMAGLGAYGMGWGPFSSTGMFSGAKGAGFLGNMMSGKLKNRLFMKNLGSWANPDYTGKGAGLSWGKLGLMGAGALPFLMGDQEEDEGSKFDYEGAKNKYRDEMMRIKAGAMAGSLDPNEFSYLGVKDGGRIGLYAGGQSTPSDYTMEDAMMTTTQDKLGGITDVMKQADLYRQGSVGQFYAANGGSADAKLLARVQELQDEGLDYNSAMAQALKELSKGKAQGGRIGYGGGTDLRNKMSKLLIKLANGTITDEEIIELRNIESASGFSTAQGKAQGGRIGADEGGLMDLGGMEKDYRNDGGFVPLGGEEKADDVPARLSKNEFVFTADAVRGAGDGDIDKGAEIMENIMKNLEQGGQISEETQGLSGAQEMFGVSERLSEVV